MKSIFIIFVTLVSFSLTNSEASSFSSSISACVSYSPSKRLITITCDTATLTDVYHHLKDDSVLKKEEDKSANGAIWLLNAKLLIEKNSKFIIDSNDTAWLKIVSDETTDVHNNIIVYGSMKIDSVKVTSWNPKTNNYATNLGPDPPRAFIRVMKEATGTTDITNSEIAYLGYSPKMPPRAGVNSGLNYDGGNGYCDAANPVIWKPLKRMFHESDNEKYVFQKLAEYQKSNIKPSTVMRVIPVPFSINHVKMLQHLSALLDKGFIMIHPKFENLITSLRSAVSIDYKLDKTRSAHNDLLDALRLAVQLYDIK